MKTLKQKEGYLNRHTDLLPNENAIIEIVHNDVDGEHVYICEWEPFDENKYKGLETPSEGYLGTARAVVGEHKGIGFHAWEQNDSEFIYYNEFVKEENLTHYI